MGFCRVKLLTLVNLNAPIPSTLVYVLSILILNIKYLLCFNVPRGNYVTLNVYLYVCVSGQLPVPNYYYYYYNEIVHVVQQNNKKRKKRNNYKQPIGPKAKQSIIRALLSGSCCVDYYLSCYCYERMNK